MIEAECSNVASHGWHDWQPGFLEPKRRCYGVPDSRDPGMANISDGYHTFAELYQFRLLYNAALFNEWGSYSAHRGVFDVHKSRLHHDGRKPFGKDDWFIVMATLPTGQISNHYQIEHWDLFQIPERPRADEFDGHTAADVGDRLERFLRGQQ